jgi:hypothetical protein
MDFKIIPFQDVEKAKEEARGNWQEVDKFNDHHHSHEAITSIIPETHELRHVKPDLEPGFLKHWISLILSTQGVSDSDYHVFELPRFMIREMTDACASWRARGELNNDVVQDLIELFPAKTRAGVPTEEVLRKGRKWFFRLDACSAKDSAASSSIVETATDVIYRVCTSLRAAQALQDVIDNEKDPFQKANAYVVPFNTDMDPSWEFRVFCSPLIGRIAAISQYRWHQPFAVSDPGEAAKKAQKIYKASMDIYARITRHAERLEDKSVAEKLRMEGFTFDVLETPTGEVQLVEINPFGAMSGCGSCLFHWLQDAKLLYGLEERVEVRIAL